MDSTLKIDPDRGSCENFAGSVALVEACGLQVHVVIIIIIIIIITEFIAEELRREASSTESGVSGRLQRSILIRDLIAERA